MISVKEASLIFQKNLNLKASKLACEIRADRDYPPFNRVMMDGIAVKYADFEAGLREYKISGIQAAGMAALSLTQSGSCLEVMTGATLPLGSDLVIPYEHLELHQGLAKVVKEMPRIQMENIHLKGSDCKAGDIVLNSSVELNGPHQGIISSMGSESLMTPQSRILIISTGDELVEVNETPLDHQIRRSNVHALKKSLELNGFTDVSLSHLKDNASEVADHYLKYAPQFDVMIYSGGVSKGKYDYLPEVWSSMGVKNHFHTVSQRPGKPLWFGTDEKNKTTVIGLPGNPVSSLVCLHRYVIPGRRKFARLSEQVIFKNNLTYFLPVKIEYLEDGSVEATPLKIKNSGEFTALAESDGFVELPAEKSIFEKGEAFSFYSWGNQ